MAWEQGAMIYNVMIEIGALTSRQAPYSRFAVPDCPSCGGILKPDVVFFGESVPRDQATRSMDDARRRLDFF
jgi:NAD-dependent SIR2 family protein deacetylase